MPHTKRQQIRRLERRSLTEDIIKELLALIASDSLPDGRLPPERLLCEEFGVSRTSLREALSALTQLGVLETHGKAKYGHAAAAVAQIISRNQGTERDVVSGPLEVRLILEPAVAAIAALRASDDMVARIETCLLQMEGAQAAAKPGIDEDTAFHVAIAQATGNRTLEQLVTALTSTLRQSRLLSFEPTDALRTAIRDHRVIVDAIAAHDPERARAAMERHLGHVESLVRASLGEATRRAESEP